MEEDDLDIAAAMGFSSFGGTKKRKFDATNSPKSKPDSSGANLTPLGARSKVTSKHLSDNEDIIEARVVDAGVVPSTEPTPGNPNGKTEQSAGTGLASFLARGRNLEDNKSSTTLRVRQLPSEQDESSSGSVSFGGPVVSHAELAALRKGVRNENGDMVYFQPSFVEDPWARLKEQQR